MNFLFRAFLTMYIVLNLFSYSEAGIMPAG